MCFLAMTLGSTVSCQQAEELTQTLAKDEISNSFTDDRLYCVDVDTETKTATIRYFRYNTETNVVVPSTITYKNNVYTVVGLNGVYIDYNDKITSISLPNTLQTIGEGCFAGMSIKEIEIPKSVTNIGRWAFQRCTNLEQMIWPSNISTIPQGAFMECTSLQAIELPEGLKSIGINALIATNIKSITFPSTLEEIGFCALPNLTSIELPESLIKIGEGNFGGEGLTDIIIPSKVSVICNSFFGGCQNLQNITLGAGVTTIEQSAFWGCSNLKTLTICSSEPPTLNYDHNFSEDNYDNCILYVPKASLDAYKKDVQWSKFANIKASNESSDTEEPKASITDATTTIPEGTYEAGNLTYSRTNEHFAAGKYVTICLPFSINLADADCFSAVYIPKDIALYNPSTKMLTLMMKKASNTAILPAGQPFMAKLSGNTIALKNYSRTYITSTYADDLKANMETKFEVYNYDGSSSVMESNDDIDVRFCGTFSKKEGLDKENYRTFTPEGSFAQDTQVNPFRAYIYKATTSSTPTLQSLSIASGGVADDILNGNYTIKGNKLIINK